MDGMRQGSAAQSPAGIRRGISGSTIKIIAVAAMLIDHIAAVVLIRQIKVDYYGAMASGLYNCYIVMRLIGRLGFPIFCFLLVEGFQKTRSVAKYAFRLGLFAVISEIPFDLALKNTPLEFDYQNVYFTLFFGLLALWAFDYFAKSGLSKPVRLILSAAALALCMGAAHFMQTDYAAMGVLTIAAMYVFRKEKLLSMLAGCVVLTIMDLNELTAFFALIPIALYNGSRGLKMKYFFYGFYPVHLALLYLICLLVGLGAISAL